MRKNRKIRFHSPGAEGRVLDMEGASGASRCPGGSGGLGCFPRRGRFQEGIAMDMNAMIRKMKKNPGYPRMGMLASHLGIVRETSRNGKRVTGIEVKFDREKIDEIVNNAKSRSGIVDVLVEVAEGRLNIGEEIMAVVVGGDIRERVFPALVDTVNRIKSEAGEKTELF
jgi:molybdopterin synthase catalytic subunit